MDGDKKLQLPRLPEDDPTPALAQADDSSARLTAKITIIESLRAPSAPLLLSIFISPWSQAGLHLDFPGLTANLFGVFP